MRLKLISIACFLVIIAGCNMPNKEAKETIIRLTYGQSDIQKNMNKLGTDTCIIEQALAHCYDSVRHDSITQDVLSSMYLNARTNQYDCLTYTSFRFKEGDIMANGLFELTPGATIAPDHNFPITGGSGKYANIHGIYTRKYMDGVYYVEIRFTKADASHK